MLIALLVLLGIVIGSFGTLIGAGGGFLLTPILLICFPSMSAQSVTAISMITVFFNSSSGSVAYAFMKRIDYKTGIIFSIATIPGAIYGTILNAQVDRRLFNSIFGIFMLAFAGIIIWKNHLGDSSASMEQQGLFRAKRYLIDREGNKVSFSFNMLSGILISLCVGLISGFLGIGGGIVHVPALVLLGFPAHFATATSHFALVFSSFTSLLVHLKEGTLTQNTVMALSIAFGTAAGAQIGARISRHLKGSVIMLCLAIALIFAGARILYMGLV